VEEGVILLVAAAAEAGVVEDALAVAEPLRAQRLNTRPAPIPADAWAKVAAGEIVTGQVPPASEGDLKGAYGLAILDAPIDRLWRAINDDASKADYTDLAHVEVLRGEPCGPERLTFQYLDVSVLSDRWWVVEQRANTALSSKSGGKVRELVWRASPEADTALSASAREWTANGAVQVTRTDGAWFLVDLGDGRTLVEYLVASDPGGVIPAGMANRFAASGIAGTFDAMKRLAAAGPGCP
jgi:hypothetical protein